MFNNVVLKKFTTIAIIAVSLTIFCSKISFGQTFSRLIIKYHKPLKATTDPKYKNFITPAATTTPSPTVNAGTDIALPNLGSNNSNVIPTPSFNTTQILSKTFGISETLFANSFGTDSTLNQVGNKFLLPQASIFGLKIEGAHFIPKLTCLASGEDSGVLATLGIVWELNLLEKKVSYFDATTKTITNFEPFVFHPKIGLTEAFFNSYLSISGYYNVLTVLSENDNFSKFFSTNGKNVFVFPEIDLAGLIDVNSSTDQRIKVEFQFLINNNNTKYFENTGDKIVPYFKIGFTTKL